MEMMEDWEDAARSAMSAIALDYTDQFVLLIGFLLSNPGMGKTIESLDDLPKLAATYAKSRMPKSPQPPSTVPDEMVSFILNVYFKVDEKDLERAKKNISLRWQQRTWLAICSNAIWPMCLNQKVGYGAQVQL